MPTAATVLEPQVDEDEAIRRTWGQNIDDQMKALGFTNKALAAALKEHGVDVSVQTIGYWRLGQKAPTPGNMVALAAALRIAPRVLFSLDVIRLAPKADAA